jgi:hypothetical protein
VLFVNIGSYSERRRLVANRSAGGYLLLDRTDDASVQKPVEVNIRKLAEIAARKTSYKRGEEFEYAGEAFQIPPNI